MSDFTYNYLVCPNKSRYIAYFGINIILLTIRLTTIRNKGTHVAKDQKCRYTVVLSTGPFQAMDM